MESWMSNNYISGLATVIITTYQRADYIIRTVESVFKQTYRPIELIVVDDGSTDGTLEILKKWSASTENSSDFNLILVYQENSGAPVARNKALNLANGEFIQEVGSDDILHKRKLETHIKCLNESPQCQSAWSPLQRFKNIEEDTLSCDTIDIEILISKAYILEKDENLFRPEYLPSAALHRREVFKKTGPWNEKLKRWQDLEYQVRMIKNVDKFVVIDSPFYFFRQHDGIRINSMYSSINGLKPGLTSLGEVEVQIGENNNPIVLKVLANMYLSLLYISAKYKMHDEFRYTLKKSLQYRNYDLIFRLKAIILFLIYKVSGFGVTYSLLKRSIKIS